jgi:hypothetical protein
MADRVNGRTCWKHFVSISKRLCFQSVGVGELYWLLTAQFEEENVMASNPEIPTPDTVNPQSPAEIPVSPPPEETPFSEPPEIVPETPNIDEPDRAPSELPPPPD